MSVFSDLRRTIKARVDWSRVADIKADCWPWEGRKLASGYGILSTRNQPGAPSCLTASRAMLAARLGRWLKRAEFACHHCDNPACVNPTHIYLGSAKTNTSDMIRRGRKAKKHKPHKRSRKLSDEQAAEIRQVLTVAPMGTKLKAAAVLAARLGISRGHCFAVYCGYRKPAVAKHQPK